jgi:beta-lactam-binding protein with PASTA domain
LIWTRFLRGGPFRKTGRLLWVVVVLLAVLVLTLVACDSEQDEPTSATVRVPNVIGLLVREAIEEIESAGLAWELAGSTQSESAVVEEQDPEAGVRVEMGTTISLRVGEGAQT